MISSLFAVGNLPFKYFFFDQAGNAIVLQTFFKTSDFLRRSEVMNAPFMSRLCKLKSLFLKYFFQVESFYVRSL